MHMLTKAVLTAMLAGAVSSAAIAQTTTTPTTKATHPNTKVYAYKKVAPSTTGTTAKRMDPDMPAYATRKWWEDKNRYGHGNGGE
jgi:hypothetical protein